MSQAPNITPGELSARWAGAVSVKTLANWRNKRIGPPFRKFGRQVLYPVDLLEQWERERTVATRG
ncbi:hypothetical protein [Dyella ginsengisoli]|uniref:hypothetical protein n=1 Tax=Dyella ginsengisoli TaxID=363848 RepID=UPI000346AAAA|nr:hypothetical protein [Dyella ginsengisoli]